MWTEVKINRQFNLTYFEYTPKPIPIPVSYNEEGAEKKVNVGIIDEIAKIYVM